MTQQKDSWNTDTGLPDDFDFTITSAIFGFRKEYQDGEVPLLIWEGESPDEDVESIIFPCGKGWDIVKKGTQVEHAKRTRFIKTSMIGKLITRVVDELSVDMRSRGPATSADVWKGLSFHMKREEIKYEGLLEDRGGKTVHLMPVAVLGKAAKSKPKEAGSAKSDDSSPAPSASVNLVLEKKLILLANKLDKDTFQSKAMEMEDVVADDDLLAAVLDDSENGFWAKNHS